MIDKLENFGEQPSNPVVHAVETDDLGTTDNEGSPLGKFKNSTALMDAYNELQGAFTRKCQKLSEVEKKLDEQSNVATASKSDKGSSEFAWDKNLSDFLKSHANATNFVEDMANEIMNNDDFKNSPDGLEKAYYTAMEKKYVPQNEIAKNQEFLEKYIYNNEEIKSKIINEYVASLDNIKSPINVNNHGYSSGIATGHKFGSLAEANEYVEHMFKF